MVEAGSSVEAGDPLVVMIAMKMEYVIKVSFVHISSIYTYSGIFVMHNTRGMAAGEKMENKDLEVKIKKGERLKDNRQNCIKSGRRKALTLHFSEYKLLFHLCSPGRIKSKVFLNDRNAQYIPMHIWIRFCNVTSC